MLNINYFISFVLLLMLENFLLLTSNYVYILPSHTTLYIIITTYIQYRHTSNYQFCP
jgi:hypothetical protein